jgi:hypothetical protein
MQLKKKFRGVLRWGFLLAGITFFLLYLNIAFYRAWLAGGPPTSNPEGLQFSAANFLSWALAFLSAGIGMFLLLDKNPPTIRISAIFLVLAGILGIFPSCRTFIATDRCLDDGGKWVPKELRCVFDK